MRLLVFYVNGYSTEKVSVTKLFDYRGEVFGVYKTRNNTYRVIHIRTGRGAVPPAKLQKWAIAQAVAAMDLLNDEVFRKALSAHTTVNDVPAVPKPKG